MPHSAGADAALNAPRPTALVHLGSGIGNIVFATPLLVALNDLGLSVDLLLSADYAETAGLLADWSVVGRIWSDTHPPAFGKYDYLVPALPPFYWPRFAGQYRGIRYVSRPDEALFYRNEQEFYLSFARALGYHWPQPYYTLPVAPRPEKYSVSTRTIVLAPGCKTGEMAAKRWPYFAQLATHLEHVVVVGTPDDLFLKDGEPLLFPPNVRSLIGKLTLRETAELVASAGVVIANDSGLAHVAGACGVPTLILFGPTPHQTLGNFPPNVRILRSGLECEPCWFTARLAACGGTVRCLAELSVDRIRRHFSDGLST